MYRHTKPYSQTHTQKGKHQTKINTNKNMKNIHTINNNTIIHKRHHDATELSLHWMCLKKTTSNVTCSPFCWSLGLWSPAFTKSKH